MMEFLKKISPPGIDLRSELGMYLVGLAAAFLNSLLFFVRFTDAYENLYVRTSEGVHVLLDGAVMESFGLLLGTALHGFFILALCSFVFVLYHYFYFSSNGSRALYTMKRLPDRLLLAKYCLTLPALMAIAAVICAFLILLLYFGFYMLAVPDECISAGQWAGIWRF